MHAWQLSALSVMPVNGKAAELKHDFFSSFSHDKEVVAPGYHKVELERYQITAELTSTTRVGFHKYTRITSYNVCYTKLLRVVSGVMASEEGTFIFTEFKPGKYMLGVSLIGYKPAFV